ncbi:MAG: chemotaxis protein CheA [Robiginitomaculum sp.]|nr:MAG: chemotaxis protein CheA [Robiginitomaculum sp.]
METIKQTFFQECEDLLQDLESGLILMNDGESDDETINSVFRAVHSIKGGAGAFELTELVKFAHIFENTLDEIRSDRLEASKEVLKVLLQSSDTLTDLFEAARDDVEFDDTERADELRAALQGFIGDKPEEASDDGGMPAMSMDDMGFEPVILDFDFGDDVDVAPDAIVFDIVFTPNATMYAHGNEAVRLLSNLAELGDANITCDRSTLPAFDDIDPEGAYLSWSIELETEKTEDDIREIFDFVEDDCELQITQRGGAPEGGPEDGLPDEDSAETPDIAIETTSEAPAMDNNEAVSAAPVEVASVEIEVKAEEKEQPKAEAPAKPEKKAEKKAAAPVQAATIRINLERVDRLINLVGELVINQAMLTECVVEAGLSRDSAVSSGLDEFKQLTREIQESVMAIRAQPVQSLFQRMSRVVRKAAQATDKSVRLVLEGEFTEVDKTIVEKLADPLTHMIRNAVDHGVETPEKRLENGKPEEGIVTLSAAHRSGKIVIEVSDDGAGVNRERVKQIAIDKGLIPEDAPLSDSEIDNLLFMPGFSTAENVTTLSGRGVGMDVVKRAIQSLGGRVTISSEPGKGSVFTISLPLTLAILDGMLVHAAGQTLVIPLTAIVETLIPKPGDIHHMGPDGRVLNIRGTFVPMIDVGYELGFRDSPTHSERSVVLSVETDGGTQSALLVDAIQDQRQVVIKSLEDNYGHVPSIAAATILGDGRIALILDVDNLVSSAGDSRASFDPTLVAAE